MSSRQYRLSAAWGGLERFPTLLSQRANAQNGVTLKSWLPWLTTRYRTQSLTAQAVFSGPQIGLMVQKFLADSVETEDENCDGCPIVCSLVVSNRTWYIVQKASNSERVMPYTFITDIERFRNQTVRRFCCLKATLQISKIHAKFWDPKTTGFLILCTTIVQDISIEDFILNLAYACDKWPWQL